MSHGASAVYSHRHRSPLEGLDPRVRIGFLFLFAIFVAATPTSFPLQFAVHGSIVLGLSLAARIPPRRFLARIGATTPFIALIFVSGILANSVGKGLPLHDLALRILAKPLLVVAAATALISGMGHHGLHFGLSGLGLPKGLSVPLLFLLRYFPTFRRRIGKLRMAMEARSFGWKGARGRRRLFFSLGSLVGTALLGSLDHGERVYRAMLARGFSGGFPRPYGAGFKAADLVFVLLGLVVLISNLVFAR